MKFKNLKKTTNKVEMIAKFQGTCIRCYWKILVGDPIEYFPDTRKARHQICKRNKKRNYYQQAKIYGGMTS